jgi:hypothetical protein
VLLQLQSHPWVAAKIKADASSGAASSSEAKPEAGSSAAAAAATAVTTAAKAEAPLSLDVLSEIERVLKAFKTALAAEDGSFVLLRKQLHGFADL